MPFTQCIVRQCPAITFTVVLLFIINACCNCVVSCECNEVWYIYIIKIL